MARKPRRAPEPADDGGQGKEPGFVRIQIGLQERPDLEAKFANHVIANYNGTEFFLSFAQAIPPADRGGEAWQRVLETGKLEAVTVARVAMPAAKFVEMAQSFWSLVIELRAQGVLPTQEGESHGD